MKDPAAVAELLLSRVAIEYRYSLANCWPYSGHHLTELAGRSQTIARVAHQLWVGPIPEAFEVSRSCVTTTCINPGHLQTQPRGTALRASVRPATYTPRPTRVRATEPDPR